MVLHFLFFRFYFYICTVKQFEKYRRLHSYMIVALMIVALTSRMYLTHDRGYWEDYLRTEHPSHESSEWVSCNCPICHAEDFLAVEAEYFDYQPAIIIQLREYAVADVAEANRTIVVSSLRGPPCLS